MKEIRYGLIGSGMMGGEHIRNINMLHNTQITAIADPNTKMRELSLNLVAGSAQGFSDYNDLLATDLCDAYVIAAPNDLHSMILKDVIQTDKPILCEKPICTNIPDIEQLIQQSKKHIWRNKNINIVFL